MRVDFRAGGLDRTGSVANTDLSSDAWDKVACQTGSQGVGEEPADKGGGEGSYIL